jgi:hypothetical protein
MIKHGLKFAVMFLAAIAGFSAIVMFLWNALLPDIFGIVTINFWQALGLLALTRILFSGIGRRTPFGHGAHGFRKNAMRKKWMKMSPEEKKKFIARHNRWHGCDIPEEPAS